MRHLRGGFSLIEVLIVIAIIAVLAVALTPNLLAARSRALDAAAAACAKQIATAQEIAFIAEQAYADSLAALNGATEDAADVCEPAWVNDSQPFTDGWLVSNPNGSGATFAVEPGGIQQ